MKRQHRDRARRARASTPPDPRAATIFVAVVVFATYVRTLGFDFTYDDHHHFLDNPFVHDLGNLRAFLPWRYFAQAIPDQGRPVLVLSQLLDTALGGSAAVSHLQSALWHTANAVLVFVLCRALAMRTVTATAVALLFGLHPVNVEAVAGIANREDLLSTFFALLTLLAARRAFELRPRWIAAMALAYALALGSKENALAVPVLLMLVAVCSSAFRPAAHAKRAWTWMVVAFGVVTLAWAAFQLRLGYPSLLQGAGGTGLERAALSPPPTVLNVLTGFRQTAPATEQHRAKPSARRMYGDVSLPMALPIEGYRAGQLALGWPTAPEYDLAPFRSRLAFVAALAALVALAAAALRDFRRSRRLTLGVGWFFAATLPVSVPTMLLNPVADRYLYLPSIGAALVLGWLVSERFSAAGHWALFVLGLAWFGLTNVNLATWTNDITLFSEAARTAPESARVQQNLGSALLRDGQLARAEAALTRAIDLDPDLLAARFNLGALEEQRGNRAAAIERYRSATEIVPIVAERPLWNRACTRLGSLLLDARRRDEAEALVRLATTRQADSPCAAHLRVSLAASSH